MLATNQVSNLTLRPERAEFLGMPFDKSCFAGVLDELRSSRIGTPARYVVTPNVDHVLKLAGDDDLAFLYDSAWLSLCDSKPIWVMSRCLGAGLEHVTGSDLTAHMFRTVIEAGDRVAMVVASQSVADAMIAKFPDVDFVVHVPPARVAENPAAFAACVDFLLSNPSRFAFVAIGAPQSERIAHAWSCHPNASGTALCIGASLEFIVGFKTRAPRWMRASGLEWLHRLASEPRRLWQRYIFAVIPLMQLFSNQIRRGNP